MWERFVVDINSCEFGEEAFPQYWRFGCNGAAKPTACLSEEGEAQQLQLEFALMQRIDP
jgi:hypothetical protein